MKQQYITILLTIVLLLVVIYFIRNETSKKAIWALSPAGASSMHLAPQQYITELLQNFGFYRKIDFKNGENYTPLLSIRTEENDEIQFSLLKAVYGENDILG